jgi:hypothetical protein
MTPSQAAHARPQAWQPAQPNPLLRNLSSLRVPPVTQPAPQPAAPKPRQPSPWELWLNGDLRQEANCPVAL